MCHDMAHARQKSQQFSDKRCIILILTSRINFTNLFPYEMPAVVLNFILPSILEKGEKTSTHNENPKSERSIAIYKFN